MDDTKQLFSHIVKTVFVVVVLTAFWILLVVLALPWMLSASESLFNVYFSPEMGMRFSLALMLVFAIITMATIAWGTGRQMFKTFAWVGLGFLLALAPLFLFDPSHLKDEFAWIRYPSALFLFSASLMYWLIARRQNAGERWPKPKEWIWLVFAIGFLYAGLDEVAQVHEHIGQFFEATFKLSHTFTDFVTLGYGAIALIVLLFAYRILRPVLSSIPRSFITITFVALSIFVIAQFFDTGDVIVWRGLNWIVTHLFQGGYTPIPDAATAVYAPGLWLNSIEEVYECLAGLLFFLATFSILHKDLATKYEIPLGRRRRAWLLGGAMVLAVIILAALTPRFFRGEGVFADGTLSTVIASEKDGMFHSDDLSYDQRTGIYIANESRTDYLGNSKGPGILHITKDGLVERLPDPTKKLANTDSVTVLGGVPFASDTGSGMVLRFDDAKKEFLPYATRKEGLIVPEAMAPFGDDLFVIDEHDKSIARVRPDGSVTKEFPKHQLWDGPEDLTYVESLDGFLITDDRTATIFLYKPNESFTVWADSSKGLKNVESITEDNQGNILVTDNGRGEVIRLSPAADVLRRWKLRWIYRDAQGIAVDENDNIYLVTANAFEGVSFMPSTLWKFSGK